jgi:peptidyl-prolyl cis-trans isomerase C
MISSTLKRTLLLAVLLALSLSACSPGIVPVLYLPTLTSVPFPTTTETPIPLAASVNGEGITKIEFQAELLRYQQAQAGQGNTVSLETATQTVLNEMINTLLLAQGAAASGFVVDDGMLQNRIDALAAQVGGIDGLTAWESTHGYTDADFRSALRGEIAAAWMRDQMIASVPATAEQVHVKQILLYNAGDAQQALGYLQDGVNFTDLAAQYDPVTKGELGWFPRGYLSDPTIEEAAFALQPGEYSAIIQDGTGFHILYIVERDAARQLSPDALLTLQASAVHGWLEKRRSESTILLTP